MTVVYTQEQVALATREAVHAMRIFLECTCMSTREPVLLSALSAAKSLRPKAKLSRSIYDLVLGHAIRAEHQAPGALRPCLGLFIEMLSGSWSESEQAELISCLKTAGHHMTESEVDAYMQTIFPSANEYELIKALLEHVGLGTKVRIEKSETHVLNVEVIDGYSFNVSSRLAMTHAWQPKHVRCVCIDGLIEEVSEIHHLLSSFAESKEPVALFCRGFSPDVLNTLSVNFTRKTLNVVPFEVSFDFEGINTLADISVVCGAEVISSDKGQLISSVDIKKVPVIERLHYAPVTKNVVIVNEHTKRAVQAQYRKILELIKDAPSFKATLYEKRLKSLSANYTVIRIPETFDYELKSERLDLALRSFSQLVKYGVVEFDRIDLSERDRIRMRPFGRCALTSSVFVALRHARDAHASVASLGAAMFTG